jgi:hypothetical protein
MTHRRRERGVTLVSLMVGLLLSLLVVLAMLSLYRGVLNNIFGNAGNAGLVANARQDGALASGLLGAQIALQGAGFGIRDAKAGSEFILLSNASFDLERHRLSGSAQTIGVAEVQGNAVLFESSSDLSGDGATRQCVALWSDPGSGSGSGHGLYLLKAAAPCSPVGANFETLTWSAHPLVADKAMPTSVRIAARSGAACWPFGAVPKSITGIDPPSGSVQMSLAYQNSTVGAGASGALTTLVVCLPNLQP